MNNESTKQDMSALALATGSAAFCMRCEHWEPRDAMRELGYVPSVAIGHCSIFSKLTEATHGIRCTAYSSNDHALAQSGERKYQRRNQTHESDSTR